jgi:hypothetical protein
MTGSELVRAVEAGWPGLPILIVSGFAEIPAGEAVGIPRLAKPFRPNQFAAAITEVVRRPGGKKVVSFSSHRK